jgi:hypothetical protein
MNDVKLGSTELPSLQINMDQPYLSHKMDNKDDTLRSIQKPSRAAIQKQLILKNLKGNPYVSQN